LTSVLLVAAVAVAALGGAAGVAGAQDTTATTTATTAPTTAPTAATTTEAATTTQAATTAAPATTALATTAARDDCRWGTSPNDSDNWLLILIGVVIVVGIVAFFVARSRSLKAKQAWKQQATALLDELSDVGINLAAAQPSAIPVIAARTEGRLVQLNAQLSTVHQRGPSAVERNALVPVVNAANTLHATLTQVTLAPPGTQSPAAANIANDAAMLDTTARSAKLSLLGVGTTA
jgi:hypothetical protein